MRINLDKRNRKHQAGFSLIEMTIVLGILAIIATTAMTIAQRQIEEAVTKRAVSDLHILAEAAYRCYVAEDCKDADNGGWNPDTDLASYLPVTSNALVHTFSPAGDTATITIGLDNANQARAQRIARAFGPLADSQQDAEGKWVTKITLGVPGTEKAFSAAMDRTKRDIKNIVEDGGLNRITVGEAILSPSSVTALTNALALECNAGRLRIINGGFQCDDSTPPPPPTCSNGQGIGSERSVRISTDGCTYVSCSGPVHDPPFGSVSYTEKITFCTSDLTLKSRIVKTRSQGRCSFDGQPRGKDAC